ncbi:uncharacterized protein FFM5_15346 [Fusarium fujikuroi]|nr:uncharacterized protein FFM5_15346 [Fusarium fujikuroi]
MQETPKEAP